MSNKSYVDLLYAQSHTSRGRVAKRTGYSDGNLLKELVEALDRLLETAPDHHGFTQRYYEAWTQARAVLDKAEGRAP